MHSSHEDCRYAVDHVGPFLSEARKAVHREGDEFMAALVEETLSRSSAVALLAHVRF